MPEKNWRPRQTRSDAGIAHGPAALMVREPAGISIRCFGISYQAAVGWIDVRRKSLRNAPPFDVSTTTEASIIGRP